MKFGTCGFLLGMALGVVGCNNRSLSEKPDAGGAGIGIAGGGGSAGAAPGVGSRGDGRSGIGGASGVGATCSGERELPRAVAVGVTCGATMTFSAPAQLVPAADGQRYVRCGSVGPEKAWHPVLSADGSRLAALTAAGAVRLLDTASWRELAYLGPSSSS